MKWSHRVAPGFVLAAGLTACATTQRVELTDPGTGNSCAYLGAEICSKLIATDAPGRFSPSAVWDTGDTAIDRRYVNQNIQWTRYHKVLIGPVQFWGGDDTSVSKADQRRLTNYFRQVLNEQLARKLQVVDTPGPGVMEIDVALTDVGKAIPVLRTVSMAVPQARGLSTLKYVATGTYAFVGSAQFEGKITDAETGELLAAGMDRRIGGGHIATAAQWQLGDAENAISTWAEQMANQLSAWTSGARTP